MDWSLRLMGRGTGRTASVFLSIIVSSSGEQAPTIEGECCAERAFPEPGPPGRIKAQPFFDNSRVDNHIIAGQRGNSPSSAPFNRG